MGEAKRKADLSRRDGIFVDTFGGRVHVEWDPDGAVTPLGQLPFFIEFLKVSGLFEKLVSECPLEYTSPNAPDKRNVLGTLLLSVLSGHNRYAHIASVRCDNVNPELLGMSKVVSEDSARNALSAIDEKKGTEWLDRQLSYCTNPLLSYPWIMDGDTTVKPLYGKQEGAVCGYNPKKPGRLSHAYHTRFMANTRLAIDIEVEAGNMTSPIHNAMALFEWLDNTPRALWPAFFRGDAAYGTERFLSELELRLLPYLSKLRLTSNVKRLINKLFKNSEWVSAGQRWEGCESILKLSGWNKERRVIVLRREIPGEVALQNGSDVEQLSLIETSDGVKKYEYAVLVTSLKDDILTIAQHYRDRADAENPYDELKNQWGWGGYTTQDIKRCRMAARFVAVVYNWWTLFVRLAVPDKHHEAKTSRPLLLSAVARQTKHSGQRILTITSSHAGREYAKGLLTRLALFLQRIKDNAEQLTSDKRWLMILKQAFSKYLDGWVERSCQHLQLNPA